MTWAFWRAFNSKTPDSPWTTDALIREELFSVERLEQHAASLAAAQQVTLKPPPRRSLNARLSDNEAVLLAAYRAIAAAVGEGHAITPAAEWLIDNYHLVEAQIRQIHDDLPPRFYRQLPKLESGPFSGYPRVFGIAWAYIAHSDSLFDPDTLRRFVRAYQQVQPLTIGELWAIAITLRVVLVENLRRAADRVVNSRIDRQHADAVADQLLGVNDRVADAQALMRYAAATATLSPMFVVQVIKRLRDQDPRVMPALQWLEEKVAAQGTSGEEMVHDEHLRQGAANVTVRNIITSMRLLSDVNWQEFFEEVSLVDAVLRKVGRFVEMDFPTRNLYRSAIEELARGSRHSELQIAEAVTALVLQRQAAAATASASNEYDPGYYLLTNGRAEFEHSLGYRAPWRHWLNRGGPVRGPSGYIAIIFVIAAVVLSIPLQGLLIYHLSTGLLLLIAALGTIPALDVAVALVNRGAMRGFGASLLPGMALREGIPVELRTMVVVPILLTDAASIAEQIDHLEVHYLASTQGEVYYALLSDWTDALSEQLPGDAALLAVAVDGIARLNATYGATVDAALPNPQPLARFYLLHRRRVWSTGQQTWMGFERKRGKLHELNRLLRGASDTTFIAINGITPRLPSQVRYVITLDADTRLPREAVRRLIGKMAHPLNRPRFDAAGRRVIAGYAVLQPRVTPSLPIGREGSLFQRVFSSMNGIDPYAAAVSDVYQDLFGAGSYAGKGIYDVDAFEAALRGRVPEGTLLSHDLFEGTFARAGLASDIEVVEEFPARYDVAAARTHRWTRGDWQLLPWILGRGDLARQDSGALPLIGLWKMLDNLRRSLSAPACMAALFIGWLLPLHAALQWTLFILFTLALPTLLPLLDSLVPRPGVSSRSHLRAWLQDLSIALLQIGLVITLLADQAWLMLDAIARTLFRLTISRRNLLEWVSAAQQQLSIRVSMVDFYKRMGVSVIMALVASLALAWLAPASLWLALPLIVLWLAAPEIARRISVSPLLPGHLPVSREDAQALRLVARRTWRYFETFVTAQEHLLPPDNFQEDPQPVVAHRTSPTNMGLYLLCAVSARDFGWAGTLEIVARLEGTLATLQQLQRFKGHFYNWYDTRDLRPLEPRYVSSVDSGNLAAHLIAVANACREWRTVAVSWIDSLAGVSDALQLTRLASAQAQTLLRSQAVTRHQFDAALHALELALLKIYMTAPGFDLNQQDANEQCALLLAQADTLSDSARALANEYGDATHNEVLYWADAVRNSLLSWQQDNAQSERTRVVLQQRLTTLETQYRALALAMEFDFLLDPARRLLSIGYSATDGKLDPSCYDLLASEARLASFFAIAKNDVPTRHWFRLGRAVTAVGHGAALISWSGSMFEYLMPSLVLRAPVGSLLEQTSRLIVQRQIQYGESLQVPWGVSESAYSARDLELTYQYSNFGVPGLGLKRGLSENVVIAPYATGLAAMVDPQAAARNYARLAEIGACGVHGYYEALDYTRSRMPEGAHLVLVRAYMAHHQGMTIVAIANVLFDGRMRARFHAESSVQATELLLQERTPRDVSIAHPRAEEVAIAARISAGQDTEVRRLHTVHDATPQTHLLANGRYAVMMTSAGSGYSVWRNQAVTRWQPDATRDDTGSYLFLRDVATGSVWSAGYQPSGATPDSYEVTFHEDRAEFIRTDGALTTVMQVVVSPEDDAEVRRLSITNSGNDVCDIDITSYSEVVLAPTAADNAHPVFSKLFIQTEFIAKLGVLLATRRRRTPTEPEMWAAHYLVMEGDAVKPLQYETDRARFVGRGREIGEALAVYDDQPLSNSVGTVLDPIFSLRQRVRIAAGTTTHVSFWTCVAESRAAVLDMVDKHYDANAYVRASTLSWTQAQVQLRHLDITAEETNLFQRLAGHVLYADASLRPSSATLQRGGGNATALWAQGISGDLPIVLLRIDHLEDMDIVRQLLRAHEYWRLKQLAVDLVILNERAPSYVQDLQVAIEALARMSQSRARIHGDGATGQASGSIFVLRTDLISGATRGVLSSVARVVLLGQRGSLAEQLERRSQALTVAQGASQRQPAAPKLRASAAREVEFFNGLGGFTSDGREYVTWLEAEQTTPLPWINVITNAQFGCQMSVEGGGYTWSMNSRENQLTQWCNDPVTDRPGEVLYVRDEDSGELWGPTVTPLRDNSASYCVRHGQGYSRFEHTGHGIELELLVYVPRHDPIKICRLKLRNISKRRRRLSVTAYVEWVLGTSRVAAAPFIVTEIDADTGAMLARNPWNTIFGTRVAFADLLGQQTQWTADRREFLGRHGRLDQPAALMSDAPLSGLTGAGLDPCCALLTTLQLERDEITEVVFLLGETDSVAAAQALLTQYRTLDLDEVLQSVTDYWQQVLGTVQVKTPDRAMDIMLNSWLLYQTLACRTWARSAFYQASGAYGFRDQLQDGMALVVSQPALAREHLLRAAGRQFPQGDVQHWWLPPTGQGVRTHISDDRIWLAYAAAHYLTVTGDVSILDEPIHFIEGALLEPQLHDAYFLPTVADDAASFFEHCARGLDGGLSVGAHGLPLMGTGDWNDGMNRVGEQGRGESVWLGWFIHTTLSAFASVATQRGETERAANWLSHAELLRNALERDGWDGQWYRRGYFDDGTPLGSAAADECRIDAIAQSWSVISGAAQPARATQAMASVDTHLIRRDAGLALLFTPPFDKGLMDPGYVKSYPPGLRENGGQYTHAATWSVIAFAKLGQGNNAEELFALLNPINHSGTRTGLRRYKVEPYVVAADVYSVAPHIGRGGWTWYTGAAGWLYRAGMESILGVQVRPDHLLVTPCIPNHWPHFEITFRHGATRYEIHVDNPHGVSQGVVQTVVDGVPLITDVTRIRLRDDGGTHRVTITLGLSA